MHPKQLANSCATYVHIFHSLQTITKIVTKPYQLPLRWFRSIKQTIHMPRKAAQTSSLLSRVYRDNHVSRIANACITTLTYVCPLLYGN